MSRRACNALSQQEYFGGLNFKRRMTIFKVQRVMYTYIRIEYLIRILWYYPRNKI